MLVGWEMRGDSVQEVTIGWTLGGSEIAPPTPMLPSLPAAGKAINNSTSAANVVYFSNMEGTNTIKLWLLG
jgi:hypothetical protein